MKRTTVFLDEEQFLKLKGIATRAEATFAEVMRAAIDEYVARHEKVGKLPSFAGIGESKSGDVSSRIDEILKEDLDPKVGWVTRDRRR